MDIRPKHTSSFWLLKFPYVRSTTTVRIHNYIWFSPAHPQKWIGGMHANTHGPMHDATSSTCWLKAFPVCACADVLELDATIFYAQTSGLYTRMIGIEPALHIPVVKWADPSKFYLILGPNRRWWAPRIWCPLPALYQLRVNWYSVRIPTHLWDACTSHAWLYQCS